MSSKLAETIEAAREMGFDIPEQQADKNKGPTVIDAFKVILEHEKEAEADKDFSRWDWRMQKSRIEQAVKAGTLSKKAEEKAHRFLKRYKSILNKYSIDYENIYPLDRKLKSNKEEFTEEIRAKALEILKNGDPIQYIVDSCERMTLGAEKVFRKLTCCVSVQNINQSAGLHPKLNGESSGGKTWTVYTFAHHLPHETIIKGSMSAKAGFYHDDGDRVLRILDDYQAGNEDLDTVIKQTSSEFHETYIHRTVANHQAVILQIGKEQTWAITSVDSSQDIQVLNRQIPINVDDSVDLTKRVNERTVKRYGIGEAQHPVDEHVLVSRAIFQILRDEGYIDVRVPYFERIEWLDTSNRRNPSLFMDLVIAHTSMFRYQREKDPDGYYLAAEEDFQAAKALFTDNDGEEMVKRLTVRERDVITLLVSNPDGLTRDEIAARLSPPVATDRVTQILRGEKGSGGLMKKVQLREDRISDMTRLDDDRKRTVHKIVYSIKDLDRFAGFDGVVRLKPVSEESTKPPEDGLRIGLRNQTDSTKDDLSKLSKKEKEREKRDRETLGEAKVGSLPKTEKNLSSLSSKSHDIENASLGEAKASLGAKDEGPRAGKIVRPTSDKKSNPTDLEQVRIIAPDGYMTKISLSDNPNKYVDHLFPCGEIAEFQHWKAKDLIERGIAEPVEAPT